MSYEEEESVEVCSACGAPIDELNERAYAFGEDDILCWSCATDRGGVYDVERDYWVDEPDLEGLLEAHSHHGAAT